MISGSQLSEYELAERLGAGGMGEVYRAKSRRDGRMVAVKIEGEKSSQDPEARLRDRFLREARILEGLKHENLPEFYGVGETPDGRIFIAMELLVGRPLSDFTGQDLDALIPLFIQCARALQKTSEAGIVHRDVSPDNFFVVEVGGRSVVKLIDFGISRDAAAISDGLTRVGTFIGKADYCSPEQTGLLAGTGPIDWRTDLYSFGLTMFAVILGRLPFSGDTLQEQLKGRLAELSRDALTAIQPPRLRRLLARMLRRLPEDRIGSFDEVVAELLRVQADLAEELATRLDRSSRLRQRLLRATPRQATAATGRPAPPDSTLPLRHRWQISIESFTSIQGLGVIAALLAVGAVLGFVIASSGDADEPSSLVLPVTLLVLSLGIGAVALSRRRPRSGRDTGPSPHASVPHGDRQWPGVTDSQGVEYLGDPAVGPILSLQFIVSGDGPTRHIRLVGRQDGSAPPEILIGRAPRGAVSIRLSSRLVSGMQARLIAQGATYAVENLSQTNVTCVNGCDIQPRVLRPLSQGDRIEIGPIVITVFLR